MNDRIWPMSIAAGLLVVVLVNFAFIWLATTNAPVIEADYDTVEHR